MAFTQNALAGKDLLAIHRESGLPYFWLKKFSKGEIKNPSVNRVEALYTHLFGSLYLGR